jgi:uncharacterized protein (TIGR02145 family)
MKTIYIGFFTLFLTTVIFIACNKEEKIFPPGVITASVDEITGTSARVGGKVIDNGGAEITERGIFWGLSTSPESSGIKLQSGSGDGTYYEVLSGLSPGIKYYVKAYAINPVGTAYGEETFFTTQINMPVVTTSGVSDLTSTSAKVGGNVTSDGGFEVTARGIFWGTAPEPRLTGSKVVIGSGSGEFSTAITGLNRENMYYVVAFATNIKGTSYGNEMSFSTEPGLATVVTSTVLNITPYAAKVGGNISSNGGAEVTQRGLYWGRSANPVTTGMKIELGAGNGNFAETIDTLNPAVTYYVRAYATNNVGTALGEEKSFHTRGKMPKIDKVYVSDLTPAGAKLNVQVDTCDLISFLIVEYGSTSSYGSSSETVNIPLTKRDTVITVNINGLAPLTNYHYRISLENDLGIVYSDDKEFRTVITGITGIVYDYENIPYETIGIGYQEWMTKNLRSVRYNDGTKIPLVRPDSVWVKLTTAAYCWYENDSTGNCNIYGALYNWYAVNNGNLCPSGWRVPTNSDVIKLVNYIGGAGSAGKLLKEQGNTYWNVPNVDSTDFYGFSARGGGKRSESGIDDFKKVEGNWWTSNEYSTLNASFFNILFNYSNLFQAYYNKRTGMSVRCVRE